MYFSVIVPVYNVEEYIKDCLDSLLRQSYKDFEIVLVNDGSTDNSGVICDEYAKENQDRVRVIHIENQGAGIARVTGIENSLGEVFLFIDADDCLREDALELVAERFASDDCDMVIFNISRKEDYGEAMFDFSLNGTQVFESKTKKALYEQIVTTRNLNTMCQKAVKRDIASEAAKTSTELWIKNGEDLLMSMSVLTLAKKVSILDKNLYFYRKRADSAVHKVCVSKVEAIKIVHSEMNRYIDIWGMPELHSKHGARIVKSWLELLSMFMKSRETLEAGTKKKILCDLAEDSFFRTAYNQMDIKMLGKKESIFAKWLYEKKYIQLRIAYSVIMLLKGR